MLNRLITTLDGFGIGRRAQMLIMGARSGGAPLGGMELGDGPGLVPAYSGVALEDASRVTARLDEEGIPYRMVRGGREVTVPSDQVVQARIALADEGVTASGRPGLEIFDRPSWGMTDFAQRVNYRRALEGELERTIAQMAGVQDVKVHLALHETSAFRRSDQPAEASVVLSSRVAPSADMVRGITYTVASAVDRLDSEHVTVVDANGRVLTASMESELGAGLTSRQLETQRAVERHLEDQATRVLSPIVGAGNVDVRVAATLNFDQVARTVQAVDPDAQVVVGEERSEIIPSEGATERRPSNRAPPSRAPAPSNSTHRAKVGVERLTVAVLVNARPVEGPDGVTFEDRAPEELDRIESLVRNSVGVDPSRGDQVSVVSVPFTPEPVFAAPDTGPVSMVFDWLQVLQKPVLSLLALVMMFLVAMRTLRTVKELPAPEPTALPRTSDRGRGLAGAAAAGVGAGDGGFDGAALPGLSDGSGYGGVSSGTSGSSRQQIAARVVEDPTTAGRAAGQWLRGG